MTEKGWGRSMLFLITFIFLCVLWNACMLTCVCMYVCGGQRETSDIFVNHSPSYSLDPRLSNSADLAMLPQKSWLHLQVRGCHTYQHLSGCWGSKLETAIFHKNWTISTVPWTLFTVTTNSVLGGAGNWAVSTQFAIAPGHVHFITFVRTNISKCWKPSLLRYCLLLTSCGR